MATLKTPRAFQVWLFACAVYGPLSALYGISFLIESEIVPGLFGSGVTSVADSASVIASLLLYWHIYKSLVHARDNNDKRVRRPIVWLVLAFIPFISAYVAWVLLPTVVPAWIKTITRIRVSQTQVVVFLLCQVISGGIYRTGLGSNPDLLSLGLLIDSFSVMSLLWVFRSLLFGVRISSPKHSA